MMFHKVVLTFLVIAALSVNLLAAPTSLRTRAKGNDDGNGRQLQPQLEQQQQSKLLEQQSMNLEQGARADAELMELMGLTGQAKALRIQAENARQLGQMASVYDAISLLTS